MEERGGPLQIKRDGLNLLTNVWSRWCPQAKERLEKQKEQQQKQSADLEFKLKALQVLFIVTQWHIVIKSFTNAYILCNQTWDIFLLDIR